MISEDLLSFRKGTRIGKGRVVIGVAVGVDVDVGFGGVAVGFGCGGIDRASHLKTIAAAVPDIKWQLYLIWRFLIANVNIIWPGPPNNWIRRFFTCFSHPPIVVDTWHPDANISIFVYYPHHSTAWLCIIRIFQNFFFILIYFFLLKTLCTFVFIVLEIRKYKLRTHFFYFLYFYFYNQIIIIIIIILYKIQPFLKVYEPKKLGLCLVYYLKTVFCFQT